MTRIDDMPHAMQVLAARLAYALVEYSIAHDDDSSEQFLDLAWHVGSVAQALGVTR